MVSILRFWNKDFIYIEYEFRTFYVILYNFIGFCLQFTDETENNFTGVTMEIIPFITNVSMNATKMPAFVDKAKKRARCHLAMRCLRVSGVQARYPALITAGAASARLARSADKASKWCDNYTPADCVMDLSPRTSFASSRSWPVKRFPAHSPSPSLGAAGRFSSTRPAATYSRSALPHLWRQASDDEAWVLFVL